MSIIAGLAVATGMVAAMPINPTHWLSWEDYPSESKMLADGGTIHMSIIVSPEGKPIRCEVKHSTDSSKMGTILCKALMNRAKFQPASDLQGKAAYMAFTFVTAFPRTLTNDTAFKSTPLEIVTPVDIALDVARLPNGMERKVVKIIAQTDDAGKIVACMPSPPDPASAKFETVACDQAKALVADPVLDENGKPVVALRSWTVVFRTATN